MSFEGNVTLKELLVRWDRYSPKTGDGVLKHTPFCDTRFLSRVVLSWFFLLASVVRLVSAVFVSCVLSLCVVSES